MKHGLLYGAYEISIDQKNRALIPSEIRQAIVAERDGSGLFVVVGWNGKLWLYPDRYYEALVERLPAELLPGRATLEFDHLNFSSAQQLSIDKNGRVLLPDKLLKRTGTERTITIIGARDHLEIWNRNEWDAHWDELDRRRREIAEQKQNTSSPGTTQNISEVSGT